MKKNCLTVVCCVSFLITVYAHSTTNQPSESRLTALASGGNFRPFVALTWANHQDYAAFRTLIYKYFAYSKYVETLGKLRPNWIKVIAIKTSLNDDSIPENTWLAWIDDDAVIDDYVNPVSIFDRYLHAYSDPKAVLIATADCDESILFNSGVLLFKKNDVSRWLVERWWEARPSKDMSVKDQARLIQVINEHDLVASGKIKIVPQRTADLNLNTFSASYEASECFAREGDFLVQPAGALDDEKTRLIREKIAAIEQHHPFSWFIKAYLHWNQWYCYGRNVLNGMLDAHPYKFPEFSPRRLGLAFYELLLSDDFRKAVPVITVLTIASLIGVYYMVSGDERS